MAKATGTKRCSICGRELETVNDVKICMKCNDRYGDYYNFFADAVEDFGSEEGEDKILIECPGASLYDETNSDVVQGVKWNDPRDFSKGYKIIDKPVYAPDHQPRRLIPRDKADNICRCQACQDLTIRMRTYNNQKMRGDYQQESPMMPKVDMGDKFTPMISARK